MVGVESRQRADAVRAEELVLVEHLCQDSAELCFVQDGKKTAAFDTNLIWVVDGGAQLGAARQEPHQPLPDLGVFLEALPIKRCRRAKGQETDHGSNPKPMRVAIGQTEYVIEEPVLLVPHTCVLAHVRHRRGNPEEVFGELQCHLCVVGIGHRQLHGDLQHVLTEESHPRGAVGLFQVAPGRQWRAAIEDADIVQTQKATLEHVSP